MLLAIDPGETVGAVRLTLSVVPPTLRISMHSQNEFESVSDYTRWLYHLLMQRHNRLELVVIEDYRIYEGKADMHTGQRLFTVELIGATRACCTLAALSCVSVPASWKGRWPDARLKVKFPVPCNLPRPHALDALKLGLAYLEKEGRWTP